MVTTEQMARTIHAIDVAEGIEILPPLWNDLDNITRALYIEESVMYLRLPRDQWIDFKFYHEKFPDIYIYEELL